MRSKFWRALNPQGIKVFTVLVSLAVVCGCRTSRQHQLENAAKDWCATLRASQIIPVYPLSEDLQPGDIFLVEVPIDQQQSVYKRKGYLPLDNHLARLDPQGYGDFYDHNFLRATTNYLLPADWLRPSNTVLGAWQAAPQAAFPTYSFSVRQGKGLNLAIPVQGVPVGLSLLGSDAADGTLVIKNARTLGLDTLSLHQQLRQWAATNAPFLSAFESRGSRSKNYLRIVSRVYAAANIDISLRDTSSRSGGLDVGAARPVDLLSPRITSGDESASGVVRTNFEESSTVLARMLSGLSAATNQAGNLLPGGSLKLTGASSRTVALHETFNPPLIIGYLGFDCEILPGGVLGRPIPTRAILDATAGRIAPDLNNPAIRVFSDAVLRNLYSTLASVRGDPSADAARRALDDLESFVPDTFVDYATEALTSDEVILRARTLGNAELRPAGVGPGLNYIVWRNKLQTSVSALEGALSKRTLKLAQDDRPAVTLDGKNRERLAVRLEQYHRYVDRSRTPGDERAATERAVAYYLHWITR